MVDLICLGVVKLGVAQSKQELDNYQFFALVRFDPSIFRPEVLRGSYCATGNC